MKIALVHAVQAAMPPVEDAFRQLWPDARRTNLLDDSLTADREAAGKITPDLAHRMLALASYAVETGANAVLFTCSAFGDAIDAAAQVLDVPVLKPNEAMFDAAIDVGGRIGMLATFAPAVGTMEEEFRSMARRAGSDVTLETFVVPDARAALLAGHIAEHNELIANAVDRFSQCSAVLLAHFSMATAEHRVRERTSVLVLSAPSSAVLRLKGRLVQTD